MADAVITTPEAAPGKLEETPAFKEALAREREAHRLSLEAEYRRKEQELEARFTQPSRQPTDGYDFFATWGEKHGLPADAGRELVNGVVGYVRDTLLPTTLAPLSQSSKRQELRSQRSELRSNTPKLAKLDDRFHAEVMKLLDPMDPHLIGRESYARALHMVIGQHIEVLEAERESGGKATGQPEVVVPGPEPIPASTTAKPGKVVLSAKQQQFCDEKGFAAEDFVTMMRDRARRLEASGLTKVQVRGRLGDLLGTIEY